MKIDSIIPASELTVSAKGGHLVAIQSAYNELGVASQADVAIIAIDPTRDGQEVLDGLKEKSAEFKVSKQSDTSDSLYYLEMVEA